MRVRPEVPAIAFLLLFAPACEPPPPDPEPTEAMELTAEDRQAIEALADRYAERALAGDWEGWAELFHPEALRLYPGTEDWEGRAGIHAMAEGSIDLQALEVSATEVEGTSDLAYVRGTYRVEGAVEENGRELWLEDEGSWLSVVRRDADDAWRFYRFAHNSNLVPVAVPKADE